MLRAFAQRLQATLYDTDFLARWGGDEFAVLIENVDTDQYLPLVACKLLEAFAEPIVTEQGGLSVSTSIGFLHCRQTGLTQRALIEAADRALYAAKAAGRNTWRLITIEADGDEWTGP